MRNISFSLTTPQFLDESKDVTRRLNWLHARPGDHLMGCEKCQGIKPGESVVKLGEIEIVSVRREQLGAMIIDPIYGLKEAIREGFPNLTGKQFVEMFCRHMKATPGTVVTRIEFRHV